MTCRNCQSPVLDEKLLCPHCVAKLSHQALLEIQRDFLPAAVRGHPPFHIARRRSASQQHLWHVEMLGYRGQAFCGALFEKKDGTGRKLQWERLVIVYSKLAEKDLCAGCVDALSRKVKEIAA